MNDAATENIDKLVRMANQIGGFFKAYPAETAIDGVREHIARYWTAKMRREIVAHAREGGGGLDPLVAQGIAKLKENAAA